MKSQKVRDLDDSDITQQLKEIDDQMFRLKFQMGMGQLEGLKKVCEMKKNRARMLTIQRERELAAAKAQEKK
jgi:large subunit ribosomal protein L29